MPLYALNPYLVKIMSCISPNHNTSQDAGAGADEKEKEKENEVNLSYSITC